MEALGEEARAMMALAANSSANESPKTNPKTVTTPTKKPGDLNTWQVLNKLLKFYF